MHYYSRAASVTHFCGQGDPLGKSSGFCLRPPARVVCCPPVGGHVKDLGLITTLLRPTWPTNPGLGKLVHSQAALEGFLKGLLH